MQRPLLGWSIFLFNALTWGSSFILMKRGLAVYTGVELAFLRIVTAGLVMVPLALLMRKRFDQRLPLRHKFLTGLFGTVFPSFMFAIAQTHLPSSTVGILNSLVVLWTFLLGVLFFQRAFTWRKFIGTMIGLLGAVVLVVVQTGGTASLATDLGFGALVALATISYAINAHYVREYLGGYRALHVASSSFAWWCVPASVAVFFTAIPDKLAGTPALSSALSLEALGYISVLGAVGTGIAVATFYKLIQLTSSLFATSVTYLIPVVALGWGVLDGEAVGLEHVLGLGAILAGVYLVRDNNRSITTQQPKPTT